MDLNQYIIIHTSLLALTLILAASYLIYRIYQAKRKRNLEKQLYIPLMIVHVEGSDKTPENQRHHDSIPDLTDTDVSSDEEISP